MDYKVKRKSSLMLVALAAFVLSIVTGCHKYEDIRILSGAIESVNMQGFKAADIQLQLEVENPAGKVIVEEASGTLKHFGKVIGMVVLAPVELAPRSTAKYPVTAHMELASGLGLKDIMSLADPKKMGELVVDVSVTGKASGVKVKRNINDIPLKKLLENR
jgi:hypothetical protein